MIAVTQTPLDNIPVTSEFYNWPGLLQQLFARQSLTVSQAVDLMQGWLTDAIPDVLSEAILAAIQAKGVSAQELVGMASVLQSQSPPPVQTGLIASPLIDTCGTGGDGASTFNISTAVAFVAAAAGVKVAKHGNRSASSKAGSADVLEALGINLNATPEKVQAAVSEVGITFLFAPGWHPALKAIATLRKTLKVRTVFNLLGPLVNPMRPTGQIIGVNDPLLLEEMDKLENTGLIQSDKFSHKTMRKWLIIGLIWGLINQLVSGTITGVIIGLIWGLIIGLINGLIGDKIEAIEARKTFHDILKNELSLGMLGKLNNLAIETKIIPNQGIWQSVNNTFKLSVMYFLPSTILFFLIQIIQNNNSLNRSALIYSLMFGLFFGLLVGILRSGTPVIKHFALRLILYRNGYIPWNYAHFLDYCTERMLLQRVGGRYRFIHKLLQDHFAQMEFKRD